MKYKFNRHNGIKLLLFLLATMTFLSFKGLDPQRKLIKEGMYKLEIYVLSQASITPEMGKRYYWYKSGEIHSALGGYTGDLLHGSYLKMFRSNNLATQGAFKMGLKEGIWKTWYENGQLREVTSYSRGEKNGKYHLYDSIGNSLVSGKYRKDLKDGVWIDRIQKDTLRYTKNLIQSKEKRSLLDKIKNLLRPKDTLKKTVKNKKNRREKRNYKG